MDELDRVIDVLREVGREPAANRTLSIWARCRDRGIDLSATLQEAARRRVNEEAGPGPVAPPSVPCG